MDHQISILISSVILLSCFDFCLSAVTNAADVHHQEEVPIDVLGSHTVNYDLKSWTLHQKRFAVTMGIVDVAKKYRWRVRQMMYEAGQDFDICRYAKNSTGPMHGWFVCPQRANLEDEIYCCGGPSAEYCCSYWQSSSGRLLMYSALGGSILSLFVVGLCIFGYIRYRQIQRNSNGSCDGKESKDCIVHIDRPTTSTT